MPSFQHVYEGVLPWSPTGCLVNSIFMGRGAPGEHESSLSQITENRKVETRKPLIFQDPIFGFYLKKATLRQNPKRAAHLLLQLRVKTPNHE